MRIGVVGDPPLIVHSVAVVCSQLAKQFVKLGHQVSYLGYNYTGEEFDHPDGYRVYPDTFPPTRKASVLAFIRKTSVEVLYAHGNRDVMPEGIKAAKEVGIPYCPHTFYSTPTSLFSDWRCDYSAKGLEDVKEVLDCNRFSVGIDITLKKLAWFVPNGVDTEVFKDTGDDYRKELGIPEDALVFLFSGTNCEGKNPARVLQAFQEFQRRCPENDCYVAMHTRPVTNYCDLKANAKAKGIEKKVKFFADVRPDWLEDEKEAYRKGRASPEYTRTPYNEMPKMYRTGDVLFATTFSEGMSTTFLEAMSCGLPVVCSDDPVISEPVIQFQTGLVCRRDRNTEANLDELAEAMEYFYTRGEEVKRMGKNARTIVDIEYNWAVIAKRIVFIFEGLLAKKYQ